MNTFPKILVLGASGMLGHVVLRWFVQHGRYPVAGSVRSEAALRRLPAALQEHVITGVDVENLDSLMQLFATVQPGVVINCVGLVKQLAQADEPLLALPINALLPHRLARLSALVGARLVHVSTDCVFSGRRGHYRETDVPDAEDLYGRSKLLGEVVAAPAITLRTSIIGPELGSAHGLVAWFLAQNGPVRGYARAIFSGLPTVELARLIHDHVIPDPSLTGLYHVSAAPITKHDLLQRVARAYGRTTAIRPDDAVVIDRSLDSTRFRAATGYAPPDWDTLVAAMHRFG